jgi:hypothetical protein
MELFRLDNPVIGVKGVLATQGADLVLIGYNSASQ